MYTDLFFRADPLFTQLMVSLMVIFYYAFHLLDAKEATRRVEAESTGRILTIQANQAEATYALLLGKQNQLRQYRHDLRHHIAYLHGCLSAGELEAAQAYLTRLDETVLKTSYRRLCENTTVNLILSFYVEKAEAAGIRFLPHMDLPQEISLPAIDLCVILGNLLENAIHACQSLPEEQRSITLNAMQEKNSLSLTVKNPYEGTVFLADGIPVTPRKGHGIGTRSVVAIVEHYKGMYRLTAEDNQFTLRMLIHTQPIPARTL